MSIEENKQAVLQAVDKVWNAHNVAIADQYYAEGFVNHDPSQPNRKSLADLMVYASEIFSAFPDFHVAGEAIIAEGDQVAVLWTTHATHQGEYNGIAPTGRTVVLPGAAVNRIKNGKIVETEWRYDSMILLQQLGVVSSPAPA